MANIAKVAEALGYTVVTMKAPERNVSGGYAGDLLSDVMGHADEDELLITIQGHKNTVAVASLLSLTAIILCNGREALQDMIESAEAEGVAILQTQETQYQASVRLDGVLKALK